MTQYARPLVTITADSWSYVGGGHTNLYDPVNEVSADDLDYIQSPTGSTSAVELKLGNIQNPVVNTGHILTIRAKATGSGAAERLTATLYQGTTVIASALVGQTIGRVSFTNYTYTLSEAEASAITDYNNLRVRMNASTVGPAEYIQVSWIQLQAPDAPFAAVALSAVTLSSSMPALDAVPGAVRVALDALTLTSASQKDTISNTWIKADVSWVQVSTPKQENANRTITLDALSLSGSVPALDVSGTNVRAQVSWVQMQITTPRVVQLHAITLAGSVLPVQLGGGYGGRALGLLLALTTEGEGGARTITLDGLILASSARHLGTPVTVALDALTLATSTPNKPGGYGFLVKTGATAVPLDALTLAGSAPSLDAQGGAVTIALDALTLTGSIGRLTVVPALVTTVQMHGALGLAASAVSLTVKPGAVTVALDVLSLASSAATFHEVITGETVALDALTLASSIPSQTVVPGTVAVALDALTLAASARSVSLGRGATSVSLQALTMVSLTVDIGASIPTPGKIPLVALVLAATARGLHAFAYDAIVDLNLYERKEELTLDERSTEFTLFARESVLNLSDRE